MEKHFILEWLRQQDESKLDELWQVADQIRKRYVGEAVHLRGLLEMSNHCVRMCDYCGLRADRKELTRYRMTKDEILESAVLAILK